MDFVAKTHVLDLTAISSDVNGSGIIVEIMISLTASSQQLDTCIRIAKQIIRLLLFLCASSLNNYIWKCFDLT